MVRQVASVASMPTAAPKRNPKRPGVKNMSRNPSVWTARASRLATLKTGECDGERQMAGACESA